MKLFRLSAGFIEKFAVAEDLEDMQNQVRDPKKYPDLHFRSVDIQEITVDGYEIQVVPAAPQQIEKDDIEITAEIIENMHRDQLKEYLDQAGVEYNARLGEEKLRDIALSYFNSTKNVKA
jgi:hypothetical protein